MELKEAIIKFRQENKISQREFARRCELSNSLISILEMGVNPQTGKKMSPDLATYKKIANGMGISLQVLFEMIDDDELVSLSFSDLEQAMGTDEKPKTAEARIISGGIDKLPKEQRERALAVFRVMFEPQYANLFTKETEDDDT